MKKILRDFDLSNLDDAEFLEDSVREEILSPVIKFLGYSVSTNNKIIRSRKLKHPYVQFGTIKKEVNIIPDYILEVNNKPFWILEAKAPSVDVWKDEVIAQAYSYAIHPEVQAKYFMISNGKEFVLYSTSSYKPILNFFIFELEYIKEELLEILHPSKMTMQYSERLLKDFGLHLKRLNLEENKFVFLGVQTPFIARLNEDLYTFNGTISFGDNYLMSVDLTKNDLVKLKNQIPVEAYKILTNKFRDAMEQVVFEYPIELSIQCVLGEKIEENDKEIFLPLRLDSVIG